MAYKLNLVELEPGSATVTGKELAIENKENGTIYLTTKPYIDKLFKLMGYKSLSVIKILEEYAGMSVSEVGDLKEERLYIDDTTQSFVVTHPDSVKWVNEMLTFFKDNGFGVEGRRADSCYYWDQLLVITPSGNKFAIYIDLCDNYVHALALNFDGGVLTGLIDEGQFSTLEGDDSLKSLIVLMSNQIDISSEFHPNQKLSIFEYVDLLRSLGYVSKKRKKCYKTDNADEVIGYIGDLDFVLDEFNYMSWLQQHVKESPNGATFADACVLISLNLDNLTYWKFRQFYMSNSREQSDMFALNQ